MYRVICFSAFALLLISPAFARYFEDNTQRCYNPNQRPGACVSIYDCQTLLSVVQRGNIQPLDKEFLRASECYGSYGSAPPYVCCAGDTGFVRNSNYTDNHFNHKPYSVLLPPATDSTNIEEAWRGFNGKRDIYVDSGKPGTAAKVRLPQAPNCGGVTITNKIYNGADTDLYEFPWLALLEYVQRHNHVTTGCAGSLISNRYVLTAAHCIVGKIKKEMGRLIAVRLGEYDTTKQIDCINDSCALAAFRVGIEETITHESYRADSRNKANDIALIRLDHDIRFSDSIRPICLPTTVHKIDAPISGTLYTVAGWGRTLHSLRSAVKQKLQVPLVDLRQCQRKYQEKRVNVVETQLCAGGIYAEDSCSGDSGGPLMRFRNDAWVLEGIISFGFLCGLDDWPAVHTRVASYGDWIQSNLRN